MKKLHVSSPEVLSRASSRSRASWRERLNDCRGASRATIIDFSGIGIFVGYCLWNTLPIFYSYYELENQASGVASRAGILTDDEIRRRLVREMKRQEIPADPDDLEIRRDGNTMLINLRYQESLYIPWFNGDEIELHTFEFDMRIKEPFSGRKQKF